MNTWQQAIRDIRKGTGVITTKGRSVLLVKNEGCPQGTWSVASATYGDNIFEHEDQSKGMAKSLAEFIDKETAP